MPPLRKKQRGLLLRLQQEKAEIKRLQEANKAARKERQLILKQQEEIERIRQTTIKLQEKLKSAGENQLDSHSDDDTKDNKATSPGPTDLETRSPSPISISSSETSSIMQKLKKMRSRMDEKFLTKREQKLMQRRQHTEELLEWKRRLDAEEAEIRQMEKQALAAWDKELIKPKTPKKELEDQKTEKKEIANEADSPVPSYSHLHNESSIPEELGSPAVECIPSESIVPGKYSPPKSCTSVSKQESSEGNHRNGGQGRLPIRSHQHSCSWSDESLSMTQSETTSDQSDIEGRIRALKDELQKRKSVVDQLKKEQKKRQKKRLKAQEAKLEITESERSRGSLESIAEHVDVALAGSERSVSERSLSAYAKKVIELNSQTEEHFQTSSPILSSSRKTRAESGDSLENVPSLPLLKELNAPNKILDVSDVKIEEELNPKSEIQEVEYAKLEESIIEDICSKHSRKSDVLLKLDLEQGDSSEILSRKDFPLDSINVQKDLVRLAIENLQKKELKEKQSGQDMCHSP
ncbi:hypothetical protein MC885_021156, partial [Smutsia gigantea]